jgi:hypothetical protein
MNTKTQYGWIATVRPSRFAPDCSPYTVTRWFDSKRECIKDMRDTPLDIHDCWGSYAYYIVTKLNALFTRPPVC